MKGLSPKHKEAIKILSTRKEFSAFMDFLKIQKSNIALLEWFRTSASDQDLNLKKARFEGRYEMVDELIKIIERVSIETEDNG